MVDLIQTTSTRSGSSKRKRREKADGKRKKKKENENKGSKAWPKKQNTFLRTRQNQPSSQRVEITQMLR